MPFTFQPALRALQQPHKHSHSLQLATHTQLHIITFNINSFWFSLLSPRRFLQSTTWSHPSTTRPLKRAASHIKVMRPPCYSGCHRRNYAISLMPCFLP